MTQGPVSEKHVDIVLDYYGLKHLNDKIFEMDLPAMHQVKKRKRASHVDESPESQVTRINAKRGSLLFPSLS